MHITKGRAKEKLIAPPYPAKVPIDVIKGEKM